MSLHLRPARDTDAGKTGAILSAFIDETPWMPRLHSRAEEVSFCGKMIDRGWVIVAEAEGAVAGFIARDKEAVNALYIAAPHRHKGIGTALLQQAQKASAKLALWTFQANTPARAFYAKHGFSEAGQTAGDNDERLPDVQLIWERKT